MITVRALIPEPALMGAWERPLHPGSSGQPPVCLGPKQAPGAWGRRKFILVAPLASPFYFI